MGCLTLMYRLNRAPELFLTAGNCSTQTLLRVGTSSDSCTLRAPSSDLFLEAASLQEGLLGCQGMPTVKSSSFFCMRCSISACSGNLCILTSSKMYRLCSYPRLSSWCRCVQYLHLPPASRITDCLQASRTLQRQPTAIKGRVSVFRAS